MAQGDITQAIPSGSIWTFPTAAVLSGYVECNGQALSRTTDATLFAGIGESYGVGDGSTTFNVPDLRGEFIRGFDSGKGVDVGREIASSQEDDFKSHNHAIDRQVRDSTHAYSTGANANYTAYPNLVGTNATGGTETRPRNIAMMYCIKL